MILEKKKLLITAAITYSLLLFLALTLWRLPARNLIPYFMEKASKGRLLLKVERAAFSLPVGCRLEKVSYAIAGTDKPAQGTLEAITVDLSFLRFVAGLLQISFDARPAGQGGKIEGKAGLPLLGSSQRTYFETKLSNVDLESLAWLSSLGGRDLKGKASGEMRFKGDLSNPDTVLGEGSLLLKNGSVDTRMDLAGLRAVPFESVRIPFNIKEGLLLLDKAEMVGPMLSGTLAGRITLNKKINDSVLDLTAHLKPGPLFEKNPLTGAFLSKIKKGGNEIILKIGGSVRQPTMSWGRAE